MTYRSLKRAFGKTSLERKCRILFGACLLLLIGGSFWRVDIIAENLVKENNRNLGSDWADAYVLVHHWRWWEDDPKRKPLVDAMSREMLGDRFDARFVIPEVVSETDKDKIKDKKLFLPDDADESALLGTLRERWREQLRQPANSGTPPLPAVNSPPAPVFSDRTVLVSAESGAGNPNASRDESSSLSRKYQYYRPVEWKQSCAACHDTGIVGAISAADYAGTTKPFLAVRVEIPYEATRKAINETRAILFAVAILTVCVAVLTLYIIVRYVIVKPLTHLRDVSDEISRGNTSVRADVHSNDEFEELATSFNRMVWHLTDTQEALQLVNSELDGKVDQLAQLNLQLYEMNRLKSDFLANMSHELRTPLNSIIGFSEVLSGIDALTDKQKRYAQNIQKSGRVLLDMINDILDLAKMEAGKMELRPSEFRIEVVVVAQCDMVRSLTENKNIDLAVHVEANAPPMFQDQSKVQQVLTNLLSNAIKFTPEGGRITVTAGRNERGWLKLTVADTGVGIAEEDREIIFEKFRQATTIMGKDGMTREYSGTGLGLSIVKELCKLMGGEVSFESELGKGSTFVVELPWVVERTVRESQIKQPVEPKLVRETTEAA